MPWIEPKTNWEATNIPVASDFNRIEGNAADLDARIEDVIDGTTTTFTGTKTFTDGIVTNSVTKASGDGVYIEGLRINAGIIYGIAWGA